MSGHLRGSIMDPLPGEPRPASAPGVTLRGQAAAATPAPVRCACGHPIWDGAVIRSRCVKPREGLALCRCKRWVRVPIRL